MLLQSEVEKRKENARSAPQGGIRERELPRTVPQIAIFNYGLMIPFSCELFMSVEASKYAISVSGSRHSQVGAKSDEARILCMVLETLPSRDGHF